MKTRNSAIDSSPAEYNRSLGALIARRATPAVIAGGMLVAGAAGATQIEVTPGAVDNDNSSGNCSLVEAFAAGANNTAVDNCPAGDDMNDTIILDGSAFNLTEVNNNSYGSNGLPVVILGSLQVEGNGSSIARAAQAPDFRLMAVGNEGVLVLNNVTLSNGVASGVTAGSNGGAIASYGDALSVLNSTVTGNSAVGIGGAIFSTSGSSTLVDQSTISNNVASSGGALSASNSSITLSNSTLSGNSAASGNGGGINFNAGTSGETLGVSNSTISGNSSAQDGGGIFNASGAVAINNSTITANTSTFQGAGVFSGYAAQTETVVGASIISGNVDDSFNDDVDVDFRQGQANTFTSTGANVIGVGSAIGAFNGPRDVTNDTDSSSTSQVFGALAFNGGPTQTHAVTDGHPAFQRGRTSASECDPSDQRNVPRTGNRCEAGAFEFGFDFDLGDADGQGFPTLLSSNGAAHVIRAASTTRLGTIRPDADPDGQPNADATGDDANMTDDEDGLTVTPNPLVAGEDATLQFNVSRADGIINAWLDMNMDGDWNDAGEQVATDLVVTAGAPESLTFSVPSTTPAGGFTARVRLNTAGGLSTTGVAQDGEVEDYVFNVVQPDSAGGGGGSSGGGGTDGGGTAVPTGSGGGGGCALTDDASSTRDPLLWLMAMLAGLGLWRRRAKIPK